MLKKMIFIGCQFSSGVIKFNTFFILTGKLYPTTAEQGRINMEVMDAIYLKAGLPIRCQKTD